MQSATRPKTGGRKAGTPNRPKAAVVGAPAEGLIFPDKTRARAREVLPKTHSQFPAYRLVRTDQLVPYATNARTHSPEQIAKIAASVKEFGFTNPVLTDGKKGIVAGHGRVLAAQLLGMDVVPSIELSHLTAAQRRAYVLADNRLAEDAGWDEALLASELGELSDIGFDLSLTGFNERELVQFMAGRGEGLTDPDEAPEVEAHAVSQLGDVWTLGAHRLVCGDCTDPAVVAHALGGTKPHLMVTDPPYGVAYDPKWRVDTNRFKTGNESHGAVSNDDRPDWLPAWELFSGDVAYVWCASLTSDSSLASLEASGLARRSQIIWAKQHFTFSRGDYHWRHELCWYLVRKGRKGNWHGDRKQTTVWEIANGNPMGGSRDDGQTGHSTQKPVECMKRPIENNSAPGDSVYEPLSGSGTTIIAAEMTGRICYAIEIEPKYCDVAIRRWQNFTGKQATLDSTGATFDATAEQRLSVAA